MASSRPAKQGTVGRETARSAAAHSRATSVDMEDLRRLQLAHEGMRLLLSSEIKQAERLFRTSRYMGPELNAGYSFVQFLRSLMTFEEDAMDAAYKCLEGTEKFCDTSKKFSNLFSSNSHAQKLTPHQKLYRRSIIADCVLFEAILVFIRQSLTSYVKGGYLIRKAWKMYEKIYIETEQLCSEPSPISEPGMMSPSDKHVGSSLYDDKGSFLEGEDKEPDEEEIKQSISALGDTFAMHLGLGGMEGVDGEGEGLRNSSESSSSSPLNSQEEAVGPSATQEGSGKSSKKSAVPDSSLSSEANGDAVLLQGEASNAGGQDGVDMTDRGGGGVRGKKGRKRPTSGYVLPEMPEASFINDLQHQDDRLRGAVYFGYGIMNIVLSLIPPKLMRLANLFGFSGDRRLGLQALEFASHSQDMKAPLARIALLWYHTIVRSFFALDGEDEDAGAEEAERLIKEAESLYPNSALFLYFKGKVMYLRCQLNDALAVFTSAAALSKDQREIEHIALYEKGWIHFLQLDYAQALPCYIRLKNETRWSACYYAYLSALMTGVMGDMKQSRELFLQASRLVKRKNNNLEKFCCRRAQLYKKGVTFHMPLEARLMIMEVIYLWRALPFCSEDTKLHMMEMLDLALPPDAQVFHKAMRAWLRGGVLNSLKRPREAEKSLREALQYEPEIKHDKHILSFSLYELAMIHISKAEYAKARTLLNFAKDAYTGYEFEARLNFKVHSTLNSLR